MSAAAHACALSVDKSYRVPTYTELFYVSPTSVGDPGLQARGGVDRGGRRRLGRDTATGFTRPVFRRDGTNLIDWVRGERRRAVAGAANLGEVRTDGLRPGWEWRPAAGGRGRRAARCGRVVRLPRLRTRDTGGLESKYVLDHLRHQALVTLEHALPLGMTQRWRVAWEERLGGEEYLVVDTRVRRAFAGGELYLDATNLFDESYELVPGVPQPGRWVTVGVQAGLGPW